MNKTGAIAGAGLVGVLSLFGRACDDIARLMSRGAGSADELVPAVTRTDELYAPSLVRYSDDAGRWGLKNAGQAVVEELPGVVHSLISEYNESRRERPVLPGPGAIDPRVFEHFSDQPGFGTGPAVGDPVPVPPRPFAPTPVPGP